MAIRHQTIHPESLIPGIYKCLIFSKNYKYFTYPINVLLVNIILIQLYFYLDPSNKIHFIRYLPFYLCSLWVLCINLLQSKSTRNFFIIIDNADNVFIPNINNMEQELRKIINSVSLKVKLFILFLGTSNLLGGMTILYDQFFYEDRVMLQSFFGQASILYEIVRIMVCCFFLFASIPVFLLPIQLIFCLFYSQIKVLQLLDKIKKFDRIISNKNMDDQCILENLKIFGRHDLDIKRFHYHAFEATHFYSTIYSIGGLTMGISSLIAMLSYNAPKGPLMLTFLVYIFFLYGISNFIQEYEDGQKHLFDALYDLKWYLWSVKCQKFHLLLMGQVSQELKIPILFVIHADFELVKKFIRFTYTVANCLFTLRRKNH